MSKHWARRWYIRSLQITVTYDNYAWAFGVFWLNRYGLHLAFGYLFLDIG